MKEKNPSRLHRPWAPPADSLSPWSSGQGYQTNKEKTTKYPLPSKSCRNKEYKHNVNKQTKKKTVKGRSPPSTAAFANKENKHNVNKQTLWEKNNDIKSGSRRLIYSYNNCTNNQRGKMSWQVNIWEGQNKKWNNRVIWAKLWILLHDIKNPYPSAKEMESKSINLGASLSSAWLIVLDFPLLVPIQRMRVCGTLGAETRSCRLQINDNILLTVSAAKTFQRSQKAK